MALDDFARSLEAAAEFDAIIDRALDEREVQYGGPPVFEHHHLRAKQVAKIAIAFRDGGVYKADRTPDFVSRAIDVKLQFYLAGEIVPALMNQNYYLRVHNNPAAAELESVRLMLLSLRQDQITKNRILWDRIMGWVYFIETGSDGIPRTGSRSAKRTFFRMCNATPRWKWLEAYQPSIDEYDDRFRTPEVHSLSMLRAMLIRGDEPDDIDNQMLRLLGDAMNQVWDNVESIVSGGGVVSLGNVHMERGDDGKPNVAVNPFDKWGWKPTK
jgi:hypothetical protein